MESYGKTDTIKKDRDYRKLRQNTDALEPRLM
jgi:hypothetical protein